MKVITNKFKLSGYFLVCFSLVSSIEAKEIPKTIWHYAVATIKNEKPIKEFQEFLKSSNLDINRPYYEYKSIGPFHSMPCPYCIDVDPDFKGITELVEMAKFKKIYPDLDLGAYSGDDNTLGELLSYCSAKANSKFQEGCKKVVEIVVNAPGIDLNRNPLKELDGARLPKSPLGYAVQYSPWLVSTILKSKKGLDLNKGTPLYTLIKNHQFDLAALLIKKGANLSEAIVSDDKRNQMIFEFAKNCNIEAADFLLHQNVKHNLDEAFLESLRCRADKASQKEVALRKVWKKFMDLGISPVAWDTKGSFSLIHAANGCSYPAIKFLLEKPEALKLINSRSRGAHFRDFGRNALEATVLSCFSYGSNAENGHAIVDALIKAGANVVRVHPYTQITPLILAVKQCNENLVRNLFSISEVQRTINQRNNVGESALEASFDCKKEVSQVLLDAGADVNSRDQKGYTSLMRMADQCNDKGAAFLIQNGANVDDIFVQKNEYYSKSQLAEDLIYRQLTKKYNTDGSETYYPPDKMYGSEECKNLLDILSHPERIAKKVKQEAPVQQEVPTITPVETAQEPQAITPQ